jgi:hypothetical protein
MAFTTSPERRSAALQGSLDYQRYVDLQNQRNAEGDLRRRGLKTYQPPAEGARATNLGEQTAAQKAAAAAAAAAKPKPKAGLKTTKTAAAPKAPVPSKSRGGHTAVDLDAARADTQLREIDRRLAGGDGGRATGLMGSVAGLFQGQEAWAERDQAREVEAWYQRPEVRAHLAQNPTAMAEAGADLEAYYQQNKGGLQPIPSAPTTPSVVTPPGGTPMDPNAWVAQPSDSAMFDPAPPTVAVPQQAAPADTTIKDNTGATRKIKEQPGLSEGATTAAKQVATKPLAKIKAPGPMPVNVRTEEIRALHVQRQMIKDQLYTGIYKPGEVTKLFGQYQANELLMENMTVQNAIDRFEINDDPRMLSQVLSVQNNQDVQIGRASDDTWYVKIDGQILEQRWTRKQIVQQQRRNSSKKIHDGLKSVAAQAAADLDGKLIDSKLAIRLEYVKGNYKLLAEEYKKAGIIKGLEQMYRQGPDGEDVLVPEEGEDGETRLVWKPISRGGGNAAYKL